MAQAAPFRLGIAMASRKRYVRLCQHFLSLRSSLVIFIEGNVQRGRFHAVFLQSLTRVRYLAPSFSHLSIAANNSSSIAACRAFSTGTCCGDFV
jgi:hypothetical protein